MQKNQYKRYKDADTINVSSMYKFNLAGEIEARCQLVNPLDGTQLNTLAAYLPRLKNVKASFASTRYATEDVVITQKHGKKTTIEIDEQNRVTLTTHSENDNFETFCKIFYASARLAWLKQSICPIFGACVGGNGHGYVLLLGQPGEGKTQTTLKCVLDNNLKLFSGNTTLVDLNNEMVAVGGTPLLVRAPNLEAPQWAGPRFGLQKIDQNYQVILPETTQSVLTNVNISAVVIINLNNGDNNFEKIPKEYAAGEILPYFITSDHGDVLLDDGSALFNGNISSENKLMLANKLKHSLKNVTVFNASGPVKDVANFISHLPEYTPQQMENISRTQIRAAKK